MATASARRSWTPSLQIIKEAGAALEIETIEIGEKVYLRGNTAGIDPSSWESLRRTKVFFKAPITTPQGGGYKSLTSPRARRWDFMPTSGPAFLTTLLSTPSIRRWMW